MITAVCPNPSVDKMYRLHSVNPGVNRCTDTQSYPGGKGVHVALALSELNSSTTLLGFWGGPAGRWIRDECEKKSIPTIGTETIESNRSCLTLLTQDEFNNSEILETGPVINRDQINLFYSEAKKAASTSRALCVSGSWPEGAPENRYKKLKEICERTGTDLWVDASGDNLKRALEVKPYGIHLNKKEAAELLDEKMSPSDIIRELHQTVKLVALTDGANGLFLAFKNRYYHAICSVDEVISTVGAGDCLTAGILHSHYRDSEPTEIAKTGVACGAANCVNLDLGMIKMKDVKFYLKQSNVQNLDEYHE